MTYPLTMRSIRGGTLGWNIEIYSTPTNQFDWSVSRAYVINIYISREISIEHPSVGLASLAQLELLIVYALMYFSGFFNEQLIFYVLFCEGPSGSRIYASMTVKQGKEFLE